jgi:hypothetical protein
MRLSPKVLGEKILYSNGNNITKVAMLPLALSMMLHFSAQAGNTDYRIQVPDTVPEGFENVAAMNIFYDVYFNNIYISTVELKKEEGKLVRSHSDEIVLNTAQVYANKIDNSLSLAALYKTKDVSIFYDNKKKKVQLFSTSKKNEIKQKAGFSWKSEINGSTAFNFSDNINDHAINFLSTMSFNDKSIKSSFTTRTDDFGINVLSYSHEAGKDRAIYGVFNPVYSTYTRLGFNSVAGMEYQFNALERETSSARSPILITLVRDAIVRVEKNNNLLKVVKLVAGENKISTNELPSGDYAVDLVINYYNGEVESKTAIVESNYAHGASKGFTGFFVGYKNNQDFFSFDGLDDNDLIVSSSYIQTLGDGINLFYNAAYDNGLIFNPTMTYNRNNYQGRFSFKKGAHDTEYFTDFTYTHDKGTANLRYLNRKTERDLYFGDSHRVESSYQYRTQKYGSFFAGYSYDDLEHQHALTFLHSKNIYSNRTHSLTLSSSFRHGEETEIGFNLSYRLTPVGSKYTYSSLIDHHQDTFFKQTLLQQEKVASFVLNNRASVLSGDDFTSGYLQSSISSANYGYTNLELGTIEGNGIRSTYLNSSFNVQFAGNAERAELVGRKNVQEGVLIDLIDDEGDMYELTINNSKTRLVGGQNHLIKLDPHKGYNISLINKSNPHVRVVDSDKQVYLHRDNIYIPKWKKGRVELLYGKAFLNGELMLNSHLKNDVSQGFTDEDGFFTLEVIEGNNDITVNGKQCLIEKVENFEIHLSCDTQ